MMVAKCGPGRRYETLRWPFRPRPHRDLEHPRPARTPAPEGAPLPSSPRLLPDRWIAALCGWRFRPARSPGRAGRRLGSSPRRPPERPVTRPKSFLRRCCEKLRRPESLRRERPDLQAPPRGSRPVLHRGRERLAPTKLHCLGSRIRHPTFPPRGFPCLSCPRPA